MTPCCSSSLTSAFMAILSKLLTVVIAAMAEQQYRRELERKRDLMERLEDRCRESKMLPAWWRKGPGLTSFEQLERDKEVVTAERSSKVVDMRDAALLPKYLNDIWMSEEPPPRGDTCELLECVEKGKARRFKQELGEEEELWLSRALRALADAVERYAGRGGSSERSSPPRSQGERWWLTARNLHEALSWLFEGANRNEFYAKGLGGMLESDFSVNFVMQVHATALQTLTTTNELRSRDASPAGSTVHYERPHRIRPRLQALLEFTSEWIRQCDSPWEALKCGTLFFSEFLLIHPFRDGNGRTARLLLSHLLRFHTWVPISLYLNRDKRSNRQTYIEVLEQRAYDPAPDALFFYVVDCYRYTLTTAEWALQ